MKTLKNLTVPAFAAVLMLSPAFVSAQVADNTFVKVEVPLEKKEIDKEQIREKIEPLKLEPKGIKLSEIKIEAPKLELKDLPKIETAKIEVEEEKEEDKEQVREKVEALKFEPKGVILSDFEIKVPELELKELPKIETAKIEVEEEEKKEEVVSKEEEKKEGEKKEEAAETKKEEKPAVDSTYEELTGLVCRQQNQIDRMTTSIDSLVESMSSQMQLMQMMTQLMMAQQLASSTTPQYGANLFGNEMINGFQAFVYGQRMGSLMNIFSPIPSFTGFGQNQTQPQAQGPVYNYNVTGDFYGQGYNPQGQMPQAYSPMYNPMMQTQNINWMDDSTRMTSPNSPLITSQIL